MKIVVVQFASSHKNYEFLTDIEDLKNGDIVNCDSDGNRYFSNDFGVSSAKVVGFASHSLYACKWIIGKVDMEEHDRRTETRKKQEEIRRQQQKLLDEMEEIRKQQDKMSIYKQMAENNDEMKALLEKFSELDKTL